jgi:flavin-dependent dehydrogenase
MLSKVREARQGARSSASVSLGRMKQVEHLIIGAGMAGLVLKHFLAERDVALLDPEPARYKIGESLIPELFRHPELAKLLPRLRELPSRTPKYGTTFVANGSVVEFPLAEREASISMHIVRHELEREMAAAWGIDPVREKVEHIDFERRVVRTDRSEYQVSGQILDCSGPAMVVATLRSEVDRLVPVNATWSYFDIVEASDDAFARDIGARGWSFQRYDARHQRVLPSDGTNNWRPTRTTVLTQIAPGMWTWQIPLYDSRVLSIGVVSRQGPVSEAEYHALVREHAAPCFKLAARQGPSTDPLNRVHSRSGFARKARVAAGREFILLADSYAFSDPVYSVGTGFAVNQAIEVATRLLDGPWDEQAAREYSARCEGLIERARAAFEFWYSGEVLTDPDASRTVQHQLLHGDLFRIRLAHHYGNVLEDADLRATKDPFLVDPDSEILDDKVQGLLDAGGLLAGFAIAGARRAAGGIQLRFQRSDAPELTVLVAAPDRSEPCYRVAGRLRLSYMQLLDERYPEALVREIFDVLVARIMDRERDWLTLVIGATG